MDKLINWMCKANVLSVNLLVCLIIPIICSSVCKNGRWIKIFWFSLIAKFVFIQQPPSEIFNKIPSFGFSETEKILFFSSVSFA